MAYFKTWLDYKLLTNEITDLYNNRTGVNNVYSKITKINGGATSENKSKMKKIRFESNNQIILPQKILVNDKKAKDDAISDGLPSEKLVILGNPVLEEHLNKSSKQSHKNTEELRRNYNLEEDKIIISFISESLTEFRKGDDELGFDEFQVFDELKQYFHDEKYHILVKCHPEDCKNKFGKPNQKISYIDKIPIEDLATLSHKIIGMGSMLLIELSPIDRFGLLTILSKARSSFS